MSVFKPIAEAQHVEVGTVADVRMPSGRVVRAAWTRHGRCLAWWPLVGPRRRPIGLYDPVEWRVVDNVTAMGQP